MTLSRSFSGSKPQRGEDRIVGGRSGLRVDPVLHACEAFRRLMDIVALRDVREGFEQLLETILAAEPSRRRSAADAAPRRARHRYYPSVLSHARAFPHGIATRNHRLAVAG